MAGEAGKGGTTGGSSGASAGQGGAPGAPQVDTIDAQECASKASLAEPLPQVAQGGSLCLVFHGERLSGLSGLSLGGYKAVDLGTTTETEAEFLFAIPHGATRGVVSLSGPPGVDLPTGPHAEITAITVGAGGNDESGRGTPASPLATLEGALSNFASAGKGDLIRIETDLILKPTKELNIPDGVSIEGNNTTLYGNKIQDFIRIKGDHTIRGLTFSGFPLHVLYTDSGRLSLIDVQFRNNTGNPIDAGSLAIVEAAGTQPGACLFENNGTAAYLWDGNKALERGIFRAQNCTFRSNKHGIISEFGGGVELENCEVQSNGQMQDQSPGLLLKNGAWARLAGVSFKDNVTGNILITGNGGALEMIGGSMLGSPTSVIANATGACTATFTDISQKGALGDGFHIEKNCAVSILGATPGACVIEQNGQIGVYSNSDQQLTLENCVVRNNKAAGVGVDGETKGQLTNVTLDSNGWGAFPQDAEGLLVSSDASAKMTGGSISNNRFWGVNMRSNTALGGQLTLDGVDVHDNGLHGVYAASGKSISLINSMLRGHPLGAGIFLEGAIPTTVVATTIEGNGTGLREAVSLGKGGAQVLVQDSHFKLNKGAALRVAHPLFDYSVTGSAFDGNNSSVTPDLAAIVIERPFLSGAPPMTLSTLTFGSLKPGPSGLLCGADADLSQGGLDLIRNLADGCVLW